MAITYPLTPPSTPGNQSIQWQDAGNVGVATSPFSGSSQTTPWPAQSQFATVTLPPMPGNLAAARTWVAFFLALNGPQGSFYLGDSVATVPLGSIAGTVTVAAGAIAGSTTLPITGGTGVFAVGDWLQVFTGSASRLHRVIQVNSGSVDVFPVLRSAYATGAPVNYTNPKGIFRLTARVPITYDVVKIANGVSFSAAEVI